jgi:hypothetical protein
VCHPTTRCFGTWGNYVRKGKGTGEASLPRWGGTCGVTKRELQAIRYKMPKDNTDRLFLCSRDPLVGWVFNHLINMNHTYMYLYFNQKTFRSMFRCHRGPPSSLTGTATGPPPGCCCYASLDQPYDRLDRRAADLDPPLVSHRPHRQHHRLRRFQPNNQHASYRTYPTAIAMSSTSPPSSTGAATTSHVQNSPQQRKRNLPTRTPVGKAGFEVWVLIKGTCRHFRAGPGFGSGCVLPPSTVPPPTGGPGQGSCQGCVCLCGAKVWSGQRRSKFGSVTLRTD